MYGWSSNAWRQRSCLYIPSLSTSNSVMPSGSGTIMSALISKSNIFISISCGKANKTCDWVESVIPDAGAQWAPTSCCFLSCVASDEDGSTGASTGDVTPPPFPVRVPTSLSMKCRSEEHTSELQSRENIVCRLLLEQKK